MKKLSTLNLILLLTLSLSAQAQTRTKVISNIENYDREGVYILSSNPGDPDPVILDCASFLFGLTFTKNEDFFHLYENECYSAYDDLQYWQENGAKACLKVDFTHKDWVLKKLSDEC